MEINQTTNIGQLVASDYRFASVFKEFNIDFCCNGNRNIAQVCQVDGIDEDVLLEKLHSTVSPAAAENLDFDAWPIDLLAEYVQRKHHKYVEDKILEIKPYLEKICGVHGNHHPELFTIQELFSESAAELVVHMKKEELILFPFIKKMKHYEETGEKLDTPKFGTVQNPIEMMHHDHDSEGERFRRIAELSNNYTPPQDACNTYRVTYALLKEFEDDLHLHIHLENNIMFPKAIALEKQSMATLSPTAL